MPEESYRTERDGGCVPQVALKAKGEAGSRAPPATRQTAAAACGASGRAAADFLSTQEICRLLRSDEVALTDRGRRRGPSEAPQPPSPHPASAMLPLRHDDAVKPRSGPVRRLWDRVRGYARLVLSDPNSRNLLGFLVLNLSFAFVELFYGVWTNSLGLISDSFHMFFDCTGLLAGLVASVITKWRADEKFSYG